MAASMLASTMGIEFNADESWDEKEQLFKLSGKFVKTTNTTQSAVGDKEGLWTTVLAAAVFVLDVEKDIIETVTSANSNGPVQKPVEEEIQDILQKPSENSKLVKKIK
ncbi:hypothetical protein DRN67_03730, partial [Candidatus Micrarchaeota archaeon]